MRLWGSRKWEWVVVAVVVFDVCILCVVSIHRCCVKHLRIGDIAQFSHLGWTRDVQAEEIAGEGTEVIYVCFSF